MVDLLKDGAFDAAGCISGGLVVRDLVGNVVTCALVVGHSRMSDLMKGPHGLPTSSTASVESVSIGLPRGCGDGTGAAKRSERGLAGDPFGAVSGGDECVGGGGNANTLGTHSAGVAA